jgi:hypothetical protein
MDFEKYEPKSTLVVLEHHITKAKFPFIDIHSHQSNMTPEDLAELAPIMDSLNMGVMVNLSGGTGSNLKSTKNNIDAAFPAKFILFANISFADIDNSEWADLTTKQLEDDFRDGAAGLKIFQNLGTFTKDKNGNRVRVNDPRLDPIWEKCGELGMPVLIHTGAPKPFLGSRR